MANPDDDALMASFGGDPANLPASARMLPPRVVEQQKLGSVSRRRAVASTQGAVTSAPTSAAQPATREAAWGGQQQEPPAAQDQGPPATRRRATQDPPAAEPQGIAASTAKPETPAPATEQPQLSSPAATGAPVLTQQEASAAAQATNDADLSNLEFDAPRSEPMSKIEAISHLMAVIDTLIPDVPREDKAELIRMMSDMMTVAAMHNPK